MVNKFGGDWIPDVMMMGNWIEIQKSELGN